jgi:uncharacterized membrane protein HdeD (DUF308 family)
MAKADKLKIKKAKQDDTLPFDRGNYTIIGLGILVIALGYMALSKNTVEGFLPLTLAPILLVLGYVVIIPIGIMYRKKEKPAESTPGAPNT